MRFTQLLYKHNIAKAQRYLWQHQRERNIIVSKTEEVLKSMNIKIQDVTEIIAEHNTSLLPPKIIYNIPPLNQVDTDFNVKNCLALQDKYVLQEGVPQACLLTKTLKIDDALPEKIKNLITDIPNNINEILERYVNTSVIFDAQQVKLPKLKDPNRPAWVFPRVYGICSTRKMHNLTKKFLQLCESLSGLDTAQHRIITEDGLLSVCIGKENDVFSFSLKTDIMLTSSMPLTPVADVNMNNEFDLPNIYPLHYTVGISKLDVKEQEDLYPIAKGSPVEHAHTIFINYDPENIKNITELPVTENQIYARSMINSFTVAAIYARRRFGLDVKELPEPVVVQCVQSNGQDFHFSVYQLNTLDIDGEQGIKNYWWSEPSIKLYEKGQYENGQPCLEGYNSEVFKRFLAFYTNK